MDHNIYIRNLTNNEKPTEPTKMGKSTTPEGFNSGEESTSTPPSGYVKATGIIDAMKSTAGGIQVSAVGIIGKATVGALVIKSIEVGKSVYSFYTAYSSMSSGDYRQFNEWNNTLQSVSNIANPIQAVVSFHKNIQKIKIDNARKQQEMLLLGGTVLNSNYGRYV